MMFRLKPVLVTELVGKDPLPDLIDDCALGRGMHLGQITLTDSNPRWIVDNRQVARSVMKASEFDHSLVLLVRGY